MVKKTLFKYSSVLMSVVLIASTLTACGTNTAYNQVSSEVAVSSEAASNTESIISNAIKNELSVSNTSTLKTNTRDEMVYVFGKADGTQDHVTVTEKVTDANGDTTTNQSSSSKSAPVSMKVTYKLNGVETKPEDMIGKSGKVTIRYDYTNNEKKTINVNGKSQTAYVPFTMITGTLLPTEKFSNVEVTNGKVSKVGDNIIALGMTMPGLKDTLNLKFDGESLDMDIPEYFEISADVEDFELDMSMSVATTSVLNDVDVDDFSLAKLEDKMNELQSAADQLADGTVTLQDGTQTLADSIPALTDGVNQLSDGAGTLKEGIYAYTDGAAALAAGADQLKTGVGTYTAGASKLGAGAASLQDGLKTYTGGVASAYEGAKTLNAGIKSIKTALIEDTATKLSTAAESYRKNLSIMKQAEALQKGAQAAGLTGVTIADDLNTLAGKADGTETTEYITALYSNYLTAYTTNIMKETLMAAQYGTQYKPTNTTENTADYIYTMQMGLLISASGNVGASTALNGVVSTLTTDKDVQAGLEHLTQGSQSLTDGLGKLVDNNDTLNEGAKQLNAGLAQLNDNNDTLNGGVDKLNSGLGTLNSNSTALRDGSSQLADGTSTLKSSSVTLADGVTQLNDGAITLKDGMAEFNASGIKAITSLVGNDADTAVDTIKEVIKLGKNYNSFLDKKDGKESSVTFIYKTAELTK